MSRASAATYYRGIVAEDLRRRVSPGRVATFLYRAQALELLLEHVGTERGAQSIPAWDRRIDRCYARFKPSETQKEFIDYCSDLASISDGNDCSDRMVYLSGDPGSGKTECIIQLAIRLAAGGAKVLILCPTGQLVTAYLQRLGEDEEDCIVVETIHSGFRIARDADLKTYAPPGRLRRYDAIIIDEASQIDDRIADIFLCGYRELPQKPLLAIGADYQQLREVGHTQGESTMQRLCRGVNPFHLTANYRTNDEELKAFLKVVRVKQPRKCYVASFFEGRHLRGSLDACVGWTLSEGVRRGVNFTWLCVTHVRGVAKINLAALRSLPEPITEEDLQRYGVPGDHAAHATPIILRRGLRLRLSRNLDKRRGFVNGALCTIVEVLSRDVAVVELASGKLCLLHPVTIGEKTFLPCAYGYATTIRKAQGASLDAVVLFFDHSHPPERGYGYVGASRAKSKGGLFLYGRLRRSDWLPVGPGAIGEQQERGDESKSSASGSEEDYDDGDAFKVLAAEADPYDGCDDENPFDSLDVTMGEEAKGDGEDNPFAGL